MYTLISFIGLAFVVTVCTAQNAQIESCASPLVEGVCQDSCPTCVLGQGHTQFCGLGMGLGAECQICERGVTYSQSQKFGSSYTYYMCANCTQCDKTYLREAAEQCTIYQDARCGQCLPETYGVEPPSRPEIPIFPCYSCSESDRDAEPQCEAYWKRKDEEGVKAKSSSQLKWGFIIGGSVLAGMIIVLAIVGGIYLKRVELKRMCGMCIRKVGIPAQNEYNKALEETSVKGMDNQSFPV